MTEDDIRLAMELFGDAGYNDPLSQYNRSREIPKPAPKRKSALDAARFPTLGRGTQPQIGLEPEFRDIDLKQREATIAGLSPLENLQAFGEGARTVGQAAVAGITQPFAELMGVPADKFYKAAIDLPETAGGIARGEQMIEGAEDFFGAMSESPLARFVEKIPPVSPYSPASAQAIDTGLAQAGKGLKMAGQQAKQAGRQTLEAGKDLAQAARAEFATPPTGAVQLQTQQAPRNPLGMYSQAEQVALNLAQDKGTGNQFLAQISKAPGVKPAELEWTGLADFLKSKGDQPVTKQEIASHLMRNKVQVREKQFLAPENYQRMLEDEAGIDLSVTLDAEGVPSYSVYDYPSDSYKTLEFGQLPEEVQDRLYFVKQRYGPAQFYEGDLQLPGGSNYREIALTLPGEELYRVPSAHSFDKQADVNRLVHMRVNDRLDANGDKVLFVEEMQSDWGQQGKKRGFIPKNIEAQLKEGEERMRVLGLEIRSISDRMAALDDTQLEEFNRLADERQRLQDLQGQEMDWGNSLYDARSSGAPSAPFVSTQQYQVMKDGKPLVTKNKENKDVQHVYDSPEDAQRAAQKFGGEVKDLGMQENTEGWVNLSLKRLITDAVNNGYKKVAFINGDQSAARYDLSKHVDELYYMPKSNTLVATKNGQEEFNQRVPADKLADYIGKDAAEKLLVAPGPGPQNLSGSSIRKLSGVDLKVGGEGMKKFYDQIVPATANKLLKKLGGGKLEPVKIGDNEQLGFTITPEMIELVKKQGLPMFAAGGAVTMAKGGKVAKGMSGISAAKEAMKAQRAQKSSQELSTKPADSVEKPRAPEIKKSGKLTQVEKELLERGGERQAKRLQRAADEIPGLEDQYQSNALIRAFLGRKGYPYQGVMTMRPGDFEEFAKYLGPLGQYSKENIENLRNVLAQGGSFDDVPFLMMDKKDNIPFIAGHEGRHRTRALEAERRPKTLVEVYPRRGLEMGADDMPMQATEWLKRFNEALGKDRLVVPEDYDPATTVDALKKALPDVYAKGGKVTKGAMSGLLSAKKAMKAQRREERVQKNLEAYMGSKEKPKTYYHATQAPEDFEAFDLEKRPTKRSASAVFVTPSTDWASDWAKDELVGMDVLEKVDTPKPRIMPVITRAKNTFDYENPEHVEQVMSQAKLPESLDRQHVADQISTGNWNFIEDRNIQQAIKDLGFDSFNIKEKGVKNMGIFNPADVKALFNRGSYDPTTADISKADGGRISADDIRQKLKNAFNFAGGGKVEPKAEEPKAAAGGTSNTLLERLRKYKKGGEVNLSTGGGDLLKRARAGMSQAKKEMAQEKAKATRKHPIVFEPAEPLKKEEIRAMAQKMAEQSSGQFVRVDPTKSVNPAGKSKKQFEREQALTKNIRTNIPERDIPVVDIAEQEGKLLVAVPGDPTIGGVVHPGSLMQAPRGTRELAGIEDVEFEVPVQLYGGPRYGAESQFSEGVDPAFWASNLSAARGIQNPVSEFSQAMEGAPVLGMYTKMTPESSTYALHTLDALLAYQQPEKLSKTKREQLTRLIKKGTPKEGKFPGFVGFDDPASVLLQARQNPALRKHISATLMKPTITQELKMPSGLDVLTAISHPEIENLPSGSSGFSVGTLRPGSDLFESAHPTYSHDIPGKFMGQTRHPIPLELAFPRTTSYVRKNIPRGDVFNTMKMVGARESIDPQYIDQIKLYEQYMKELTGRKKGGLAKIKKAKVKNGN